ncbi:MAG TPA: hypothetical protein VMW48_18265 [Vicinamibacterales bacterium]|nr:hypothetical protein [Vicinamibacterales bacterium]
MTRTILIALGTLAVAANTFAQANPEVDKALLAAPNAAKEGAAVIKWKADGTYDTLKPGTNRLACYDQSGQPTEQPFAVQCTSIENLKRVAQNKKFEMEPDRAKRQEMIAAAEKDGTREKAEYGSVFFNFSGKDEASARRHMTIAVPGATTASTGLPDNNKMGGAWIMGAGTANAHIMVPGS